MACVDRYDSMLRRQPSFHAGDVLRQSLAPRKQAHLDLPVDNSTGRRRKVLKQIINVRVA